MNSVKLDESKLFVRASNLSENLGLLSKCFVYILDSITFSILYARK